MKKTIFFSCFIISIIFVSCHSSQEKSGNYNIPEHLSIPDEFFGNVSLFILVGQSNMSGRGEMPEQPLKINKRVLVFGNDYRWHYAKEPIDNPAGQVDSVSVDIEAGYSIAYEFAKTLLEKDPDIIIGFIPCAFGGSSIETWQRNLSENSLYGSCIKRTMAASTAGHIQGLLFAQGAADARDPQKYPNKNPSPFVWGEKFIKLITDIRMDLGMRDLPVVFSQIGITSDPDGWPYWELVKKQQAEVSLHNMAMINESGIPISEGIHFTKEGLDMWARRFAEAFWKLTR